MEEGMAPKAKVSHRLLRVLARIGTNSNYMGIASLWHFSFRFSLLHGQNAGIMMRKELQNKRRCGKAWAHSKE